MSSVRGGEKSAGGEDGESVGEAQCVLKYGFECCGVVQVKRSDDFLSSVRGKIRTFIPRSSGVKRLICVIRMDFIEQIFRGQKNREHG